MIAVLDHNGTVIHLAHKNTHYTLCGMFRIGGQRGPGMKRVKDLTKAPTCLRCVLLRPVMFTCGEFIDVDADGLTHAVSNASFHGNAWETYCRQYNNLMHCFHGESVRRAPAPATCLECVQHLLLKP